jgi:hypothetical protein
MAKDIMSMSVVEDNGTYTITVTGEKAEKIVKGLLSHGHGCCCCTGKGKKGDEECCE